MPGIGCTCLIITADDFGYSEETDAGIIECFKNGAITGASLMTNGHSVLKAVTQAKTANMPIGLHLNLTEGLPVKVTHERNSLTDEDGFMLGKFGLRKAAGNGNVNLEQVKEEIQAQIDRFKELTGQLPVKVDGHQHAHVIPGICEVFAEVLEENGITMSRLPVEKNIASHEWSSQQQEKFMQSVVQQSIEALEIFTSHGIWCPGFVGLKTMGKDMTYTHLSSCIHDAFITQRENFQENSQNDIVCELMVHPGKITGNAGGCGNGPDVFSQSEDREHEMEVLMSEKVRQFYKQNDIILTSFRSYLEKLKRK